MTLPAFQKKTFAAWAMLFGLCFIAAVYTEVYALAILPFVLVCIPVIIQYPQALFFALICALPLSIEYQVTPAYGTDLPDEFLMIALTGLFILLWANNKNILPKAFIAHPLFLILIIHLVWIVVCCIFSVNPFLSIKYLLAKIWYVVPFVLLPAIFLSTKKTLITFSYCLVLPMVFVVLQSIYRHAATGFSFDSINDTLQPFFRNHVNYSAMLVCLLPVAIAWIVLAKKKSHRQAAIVILSILLAGVVLCYSRGAWLAVVVAAVAFWGIRKKIIHWLFLGSIIVTVAAFAWLLQGNRFLDYRPDYNTTIFHKDFEAHLIATYNGKDVSTAERFYRWTAAVNMVAEKPVTGFGPNNFYDNYRPYAVAAYKTWVSDNKDHSTVHNYFLLLLTEQGVTGLLVFLVLLGYMFWYTQQLYHRVRDNFYKTVLMVIATVLTMIVTVNFLSDLIETDKIGSLFFLCLGLLISIGSTEKSRV